MSITREDKREVCEKLLQTLQATRHMDDLVDLEYSGMLTCGESMSPHCFGTAAGRRSTSHAIPDMR